MFRDTPKHFDQDLNKILDRVYGAGKDTEPDSRTVNQRELLVKRERSSLELKQALAGLRDRREKSQYTMRMQEELDYLQKQIKTLRSLSEQIDSLREKLAATD